MLLFAVVGYLCLTILIGLATARRVTNAEDYVLAGRRLPLVMCTFAMFATWFGAETVMGASSEFITHGLIGVIEDPFGAALCLVLVGLLLARRLYRLQILTLGDYYRLRYGPTVEWMTSVCMVFSYFGWIAAQLVAMGLLFEVLADLPLAYGIIVSALVVTLYTYYGGMWAIALTDLVQTVVILGGLGWLAWDIHRQTGGLPWVTARVPADFFRFWPARNFGEISTYVAAWFTIGLGSLAQQDVFQRVMSARSARSAVQASWLSGLMYLTVALLPLFIALSARLHFPEFQSLDPQQVLLQTVFQYTTLPVQILFFGALLSAILSTTSAATLAPATIVAENLIRPQFPDKYARLTGLQVNRYAVLGMAAVALLMAQQRGNIYALVAQSSALSLVSLLVPLLAGLYWPRANARGARWALLGGLVVWGYFEIFPVDFPSLLLGLGASMGGMLLGSYWPARKKSLSEAGASQI